MGNCIYKRKSELFNKIKDMDFVHNKQVAEKLFNDLVKKCYNCCGNDKCKSYPIFIYEVAEKYKESKK